MFTKNLYIKGMYNTIIFEKETMKLGGKGMKKASKNLALVLSLSLAASGVSPAAPTSAATKPGFAKELTTVTKGSTYTYKVKRVKKNTKLTWKITSPIRSYVSFKKNSKVYKETTTATNKTTSTNKIYVRKNAAKAKTGYIKVTVTGKNGKKYTISDKIKVKKQSATVVPTATEATTVEPTATVEPATTVEPTATIPLAPTAEPTEPATTEPTATVEPTATASTGVEPTVVVPTQPVAPTTDPSQIVDKVTITAVGRTWIDIAFPDAIDSSAVADNFKITTTETNIAATVTSAHWGAGYKNVRLNVTGLQYGLTYTVSFNGLKSNGVSYPVDSLNFKSSTVEEAWTLQIVPERETLTADGADNMKVTFNLIDSGTGLVDPNADEIVLELSTTYGNFQTTELVLQDGTGTAVLRSDAFPVTTNSKIHVEVKETSSEYTFLKGTVSADRVIVMEAPNYSASGEATLTKAESGQADRITLYFDKPVTVASFIEYNKDLKEYKTEWVAASTIGWDAAETDPNVVVQDGVVGYTRQKFINTKKSSVNFTVTQVVNGKTVEYPIVGLNTVKDNPNALELVLHEAKPLNDNNKVSITYNNEKANIVNKQEFTLTDVTAPKFVSATSEGLKRVVVKFSEPIPALVNQDKKVNDIFNVEAGGYYSFTQDKTQFGTFNPATLEDTRNSVVLTLDKNSEGQQEYFQERTGVDDNDDYKYQIAITNVVDYAGTNSDDKENVIDANADNYFKVTGDTRRPEATVTVESPEQFRVSFNCPVTFIYEDGETIENIFQKAFRVDNGNKTGYVNVFVDGKYEVNPTAKILGDSTVIPTLSAKQKSFFNITALCNGKKVANTEPADEFVVELTQDWTKVYKTSSSNKNYYNDKFEFKFNEQTIINDDNGWKNNGIELNLNYAASIDKVASPLNSSDLASPSILDIQETSDNKYFTVVMDEPIQYNNTTDVLTKSTNTLSETVSKLNDVTVSVEGTDPAGKNYTFNGIFRGYDTDADKTKTDTMLKLEIVDNDGRTLQDLVDDGYGNEWKVILHYPYDDVLNSADTVYKVFTVEPSEENVFQIQNVEGIVGTDNDIVTVTFTKGVATNSAALKPASWTINGTKLVSAPIKVVQSSGTAITGYRSITITLPAGTLTAGKSTVIGVDQTITSALGIELTGDHEITFVPVTGQ